MRALADQGVREVVLLGQTVNSYWDQGTPSDQAWRARLSHLRVTGDELQQQQSDCDHEDGGIGVIDGENRGDVTRQYKGYEVAQGFTQRSKPKKNSGNSNNDDTSNVRDPEGGVRCHATATTILSHTHTFLHFLLAAAVVSFCMGCGIM